MAKKQANVIVTFTGGMGAQILSAAIYFSMRDAGKEVYADCTYFNTPEKIAYEGQIGKPSHWAWQLSPFGLHPSDFNSYTGKASIKQNVIVDGPRKIFLALSALQSKEIQKYFSIENLPADTFYLEHTKYVCAHIRRGDYLNVASHIIPDEDFLNAAGKFSPLCNTLVVVSDSNISQSLKNASSTMFGNCVFLDNIDAISTHRIMRNASALICSNSQFSLVAAALNTKGVALVPKNWGNDHEIAEVISMISNFQTL